MDSAMQKWSTIEKIGFRFVFLLLVLFMIFFNNGALPFFTVVMQYPMLLLRQFIPWMGENWLKLPYKITEFTNGSGDTTYDYLVLLCVALTSGLGAIVWSIADRKHLNYQRLYYWVSVAVRFYVGLMLINYGLVKVIQLQFQAPGLYRLLTTYGESSPMGLAWTFLGFSKGYNLFMGIAELSACLLFFRRTVTIGAIISLMTTANVMVVNYFYDVPVKIVSTGLVVMCLFLLAPNFVRLFNFFIKGEVVGLRALKPLEINRAWKRNAKYAIKYLLIVCTFVLGFRECWIMNRKYGRNAPKSQLYGAYRVDTFVRNHQIVSQEVGNRSIWKMVIMDEPEKGSVQLMDDDFKFGMIKADTLKKKIAFVFEEDPKTREELRYEQVHPTHFILKGQLKGDSVEISLTKIRFELTERKLNWINERPFNR